MIFLLLQVWLILTGKIDYPWAPNWYQFKDWNGNSLYVPTTACFSLIFSVLAMIKAVIHFNIARVHVGVSVIIPPQLTKRFLFMNYKNFKFQSFEMMPFQKITSSQEMWSLFVLIFDHLPYFMASMIFKLGSILLLAVYLPFGLIVAIPLIILCNLIIGYQRY